MSGRNVRVLALCLGLCCAFFVEQAAASELSRADAKKLLGFMGCADANIGILVNGFAPTGFSGASGGSVAFVSAVCDRNGHDVGEEYTFIYDTDVGWAYYEPKKAEGRIRRWTLTGYAEVIGPNRVKEFQQKQQKP